MYLFGGWGPYGVTPLGKRCIWGREHGAPVDSDMSDCGF